MTMKSRPWPLIPSMLLAIAVVTGLAWWDEQREADAALRDLESEQTSVAAGLAASLRAHLATVERDGRRVDVGVRADELLDADRRVGPMAVAVFLASPGATRLRAIDGGLLDSGPILTALAAGATALRLTRPQAAAVGLPARTAMAGLAYVDAAGGRWGVVAVTSAARERDREKRALWRLVLGVGMASGLVFFFGGIALRQQRKELGLARELAVAEAQRAGDNALARAQRIATMGTFALGIAHEVATPLGVIVGRSEQLLGRVEGDERTARAARIILEQADRIQQTVRRFLDMARGGPPSLARADPSDVARAAVASVEHRFAEAEVELKADIPATMPVVRCDRDLLEHALVNLLLNACDACHVGQHVALAARADAERVAYVVTDDGAGITQEHAAMATEPFFTTKPEGQGSGLGLAIAAEIVKSHRGELTIAPDTKRGTRACIEIPIA
jgi:two-component system, NtrC family, sensor kinase